jgi:TolB-like protein
MSGNPNKLFHFWKELKRRRVIHVVIVYATAAFVIIELVGNVYETLNLPNWTPALTLLILVIGFPLAIIFSWIFDVTPGGIEKTKPSREILKGEETSTPNSWRVATYVSGLIILGLLALNIFGGKKGAKIDESLDKSIAVIPFLNFSVDAEQEFMCLGLTDEIINHLFRIESFDKVISLSSVMTYIGSDKKIPEIADELKVNYILEGTYKKIGDQIRVTAQLIEAGSDTHLWEHEYDCPYEEIIAIQADIALQIADHIRVFISDPEKQRIQKIPTANQRAYEFVQEALYLANTEFFNKGDQILQLGQQALELDPSYADAYMVVANIILSEGYYFGGKEMQSVAWEVMPYINNALELDPENAWAIGLMAMINFFVQWDYIEAAKNFSHIAYYIPSDFILFNGYLTFLTEMGQCEELLALAEKSEFSSRGDELRCHILQGNHPKGYALIPNILGASGIAGFAQAGEAYIWLGAYDSARFYLEAAMQVPEEDPEILAPRFQADLALAYRMTGEAEKAGAIIDQLIRSSDTTAVGSPAFFTGWYYSAIGETDSAFYWLEKAYQNRSPEMPWLKVNPAFNSVKDDPRYWDLYERTGHKAYDNYLANKKGN